MRKFRSVTALILAVFVVLGSLNIAVFADSISVTVTDDTYINLSKDASNAESTNLVAQNKGLTAGQWRREILLRWDLSKVIPAGKEIDTAVLKIYQSAAGSGTNGISVYAISKTDYPEAAKWTDFGESPSLNGVKAATFNYEAKDSLINVDLSDYFNSIKTDKGVHAFAVFPDTLNTTFQMYSKEASDGIYAPVLEITLKDIEDYEGVDPVVITASEDTYVNKSAADSNFYSEKQLLANNVDTAYRRVAYVKFDLSGIAVPEGYEIDTVTLTMHASSAYGTANTVNLFVIPSDTDFTTVTANTMPDEGILAGTGKVTPKVVEDYNIDITDYIKTLSSLEGKVAFAVNGNSNGSLYISSIEGGSANAPRITVNFAQIQVKNEQVIPVKEIAAFSVYNAGLAEPTAEAKDVVYTPYANKTGYYSISTDAADEITNEVNRYVMMSFDIDKINVPDGKVIKSAVLKTYFMNNYSEQPVIIEALGVSDTSFGADTATWNNQPATDGSYIGHGTVGCTEGSNTVNDYTVMDITPYITSQYGGGKNAAALALHMSGIYKKSNNKSGSVTMKAYEEGGLKNPVLEITFGEPDESLSFGKAVFYKYRYNTPVTALSPGRVIVEIPAEYSGSEVKTCNMYLAAYSSYNSRLLWAGKRAVSFGATNGSGVTAIFTTAELPEDCTWKAFLWSDGLEPLIAEQSI